MEPHDAPDANGPVTARLVPRAEPTQVTASLVAQLRAAGCVFAEDEARLLLDAASSAEALEALVAQRVAGLPLEQVVGWAEFFGLRIAVDPGVFVPRRRTEVLARESALLARPGAVVVDLCCGSGAVATALAASVPGLEVHAADLDPAAVDCARRNLSSTGARVYVGDLYDPLPSTLHDHVDVLVANAPYVPTSAIALLPTEARDHEPRTALDGGTDGLDVLRRVVAGAPRWLSPGGHLLVESTPEQAAHLVAAISLHGLVARVVVAEEHGSTVVIASRAHATGAAVSYPTPSARSTQA